jgi:lysozyme
VPGTGRGAAAGRQEVIGPRGRDLIRAFESLRLEAYDDGVGVFTIGWGHTRGVQPGDTCTREQAEQWLAEDLAEAETGVDRYVSVSLSEAQRDALASFVFNLGAGAFGRSELCRFVNARQNFSAARAFLHWTMAGGRPMRGLLRRRLAEAALYADDPWPLR